MPKVFEIKGFTGYEIIDKVLYRKAYKTPSATTKWQYRARRRIEPTLNNGLQGYILVKNKQRKWYSIERLRPLLKEVKYEN
jgi:hypothetical protein